jgi:hypothetical protein
MRLLSMTLCLWLFVMAAPAVAAGDPVRVLLLDYDAPAVHDVLTSYLCVEPCTHDGGCPTELVKEGVDLWSESFAVYRPPYLGKDASFVVRAFKDRGIDLLSFAGTHDAGYGDGRFDVLNLEEDLQDIDGAKRFFIEPSLVLLGAVAGEAPPELDGAEAFLHHLVEAGRIGVSDLEPFLWAMESLVGTSQLYPALFPNACLATLPSTDEGDGETIESVVDALLSRLGSLPEGQGAGCPNGWPCNLCRVNRGRYKPLADALASFLRGERRRIHQDVTARSTEAAAKLNAILGETAFEVFGGACPSAPPGTPPAWSNPRAGEPFARLMVELLGLDTEALLPSETARYWGELVDRLSVTEIEGLAAIELRAWIYNPSRWEKLEAFVRGPLLTMSSFRQRDFFAFFASLRCGECLELALADDMPSILRENAARRLVPEVGPKAYRRALADSNPRIRHAAASRFAAGIDAELIREAAEHVDPVVRRLAAAGLSDHSHQTP